jgi:2-amino-4-hydroxy-6-hydroxymethyldihydropteridine diphosphokinase
MNAPRRPPARQAFISAGSNLGDRAGTLRGALAALARTPGIARTGSSPLYETAPVDVPDQPAFLNLVAGVETTLSPERLLARLLAIEADFGRVRDPALPSGPRTLDLDLLLYEGETRAATAGGIAGTGGNSSAGGDSDSGTGGSDNSIAAATLILPHPRMWQRAFVLAPLAALLETGKTWMRGGAWAETRARLAAALRTPGIAVQKIRRRP